MEKILKTTIVDPNGVFHFYKSNALMGEERVEFRDVTLSVPENVFENIFVFEMEGNPYLQVSNPTHKKLFAVVYDITGKQIVPKTGTLEGVLISHLQPNALYFVRLEDEYGLSKTYKFIKK